MAIRILVLLLVVSWISCGAGSDEAVGEGTGWPELALGHAGVIDGLVFDEGGKQAVTVGRDGRGILWDLESGEVKQIYRGDVGGVTAVDVSEDFEVLVTGGMDGTARIWEVVSGREIRRIEHEEDVDAVAISGDGKLVVTLSGTKVAVWDAKTGEQIREVSGSQFALAKDGSRIVVATSWPKREEVSVFDVRTGEVLNRLPVRANVYGRRNLAMSADGAVVAVVANRGGKEVKVFDGGGKLVRTLKGIEDEVRGVWVSADGGRIFAGDGVAYPAKTWNARTGALMAELEVGKQEQVRELAIGEGGRMVLGTTGGGKALRLWEVEDGKEVKRWEMGRKVDLPIAVNALAGRIAVRAHEGGVFVWDWANSKRLRVLKDLKGVASSALFFPDGKRLAVGVSFEPATVWEVETEKPALTLGDRAGAFAFDAKGKWLATGKMSLANEAAVWDAGSGKLASSYSGEKVLNDTVIQVGMGGDGSRVVSGGWGAAVVWDAKSGEVKHRLQGHENFITDIAVSEDGRVGVVVSLWGAQVWDLEKGKQLGALEGERIGKIGPAVLSADGDAIFMALSDGGIGRWGANGDLVRLFQGVRPQVLHISLSPDGERLWTTGAGGTTRVWDTASGREFCRCLTFEGGKEWLVLAPDGRFDGSPKGMGRINIRGKGGLLEPVEKNGAGFTAGLMEALLGE